MFICCHERVLSRPTTLPFFTLAAVQKSKRFHAGGPENQSELDGIDAPLTGSYYRKLEPNKKTRFVYSRG